MLYLHNKCLAASRTEIWIEHGRIHHYPSMETTAGVWSGTTEGVLSGANTQKNTGQSVYANRGEAG